MTIAQTLLPEFDQEMTTTRRLLERVPTDKGPWKPHPKSFALGHLAQLVAWMPGWIANTVAPHGARPRHRAEIQLRNDRDPACGVRSECPSGTRGTQIVTGRGLRRPVVTQARRSRALYRTPWNGGADPHQSPDPSSRPTQCLPASQRCATASDIWPHGR